MAEDGSIQSSFAADAPQSPLFEEADSDNSGNNNNDDSTKQRQTSSGTAIGATQVNERAVNLYTRQYRGRNRVSQRIRARQERAARREAAAAMAAANNNDEEVGTSDNNTQNEDRRASLTQMVRASVRTVSQRRSSVDTVVTATLVEDAEIVMATEMGFCERNWKRIVAIMVVVLVLLALLLGLFVNKYESAIIQEQVEPTASPTFDSTPTLQTVQERGFIRCGMNYKLTNDTVNFRLQLCRAVAAVVVGDANSYELVPITLGTRWDVLNEHKADLLIGADTHTIQREIGRGFTFSTPYNYDGIAYAGNKTYRECAEARQRYGVCSSLSICVLTDSTSFDFVSGLFPRKYYMGCSSMDEMRLLMANETCNIAASELTILLGFGLSKYGVGDTLFTKDPHAFVTRNNDREFSDVVNWVLHALFFGEEQGLRQNATECIGNGNSTKVTQVASELNYLDAVYCVGSYAELYDFPDYRSMNRINNGTKMLFATPFGDLDFAISKDPDLTEFGPQPDSTFAEIMNNGTLNCGIVTETLDVNETESEGIVGMSTDYCRTLAAAIFYGNYKAVNLVNFSSVDEAYLALQNGTVDVLTGTVVNKARDFGGNDFSTPYYYESGTGREPLIAHAFATREDDILFTSFVNCVVLATIYAEERGKNQVPLASIFGEDLRWSLRDAVSYSNSYDDLYSKHFGLDSDRGRNELNRMVESTPQLHSLPGLN